MEFFFEISNLFLNQCLKTERYSNKYRGVNIVIKVQCDKCYWIRLNKLYKQEIFFEISN